MGGDKQPNNAEEGTEVDKHLQATDKDIIKDDKDKTMKSPSPAKDTVMSPCSLKPKRMPKPTAAYKNFQKQ